MIHDATTYIRKQWMGALALFLVLSGGSAYALAGHNSVFSDDIRNGQVKSADVRDDDLAGGGLTGRDIQDHSGVNTCPDSSDGRIGELCVRVANLALTRGQALAFCADLELRLPSLSEAVTLATKHDIPNVDNNELFWTDEFWTEFDDSLQAEVGRTLAVFGNGQTSQQSTGITSPETVCVTTPSN